ncbi:MAG TPA: RidA family protein [Puia sp.]|jgi:enamine deaminase RidA (YjgF/YER057c/UK114 family)
MKTERRSMLKKIGLSVLGFVGLRSMAYPESISDEKKVVSGVVMDQEVPLFSGSTKFGNLLFIAGKGAHYAGDIKAHTETVLQELEKELVKAGSSMKNVLKVSVFLNDIADYDGMNSVYRGRFGDKPPVRTTVAVAKGGVPGNSLVEMDCIAYIP